MVDYHCGTLVIISVIVFLSVDHSVVGVLFLVMFYCLNSPRGLSTRWKSTGCWDAANGKTSA